MRLGIVRAAAELVYSNGVAATSLDDVCAASSSSRAQLDLYFADKADLIYAVIALRAEETLSRQTERLRDVDSLEGLQGWADAIIRRNVLRNGAWGCELGSLVADLADVDELARARLAHHFGEWEGLLAAAFDRMRARSVLRADTDSMRLAVAVLAAVQGGYLLAQSAHDADSMKVALAMAMDHVRSHAAGRL